MSPRYFLKLGGSLITDKTRQATFLPERMTPLARAIHRVHEARPELGLLIGHGSGSFGHFAAHKYHTAEGVHQPDEWRGFAEVGRVARDLNQLVSHALSEADVPIWPVQPSASAECADGKLLHLDARPIDKALAQGLVPLVYGDVALDTVRGGTIISTESIFFYLAPILRPERIFLLGEVEGVLDTVGQVVRRITPQTLQDVVEALGGSRGVDVTGGMASKVLDMLRLAEALPGLKIHILSGQEPEVVAQALLDSDSAPGTILSA
jgi:isopentenyl phosphate kinase